MSLCKKKRYFKYTQLILFCVICFASCRSAEGDRRPFVYLTNKAKYLLLPAEEIEKPLDMPQFISAFYGGSEYYFNAWVRADESRIEMILFNELGPTLGELSYSGSDLYFSSRVFPASLKPEYIVADFQLCFYNPAALRRALNNCGLVFESTGTKRRVLEGKKLIAEIEKTAGSVKLINHLRGYTYTLEGDFE